jgi:UDP-glucuronate 4-epimerase
LILVTGGAGFIGSNLVRQLAEYDKSILIIDDFNNYYPTKFKEENVSPFRQKKNITIVKGDISDHETIDTLFAQYKFDAVIHLAARAGVRPSIENPLLYEEVNIRGTLLILEAMRQHDCHKFYFASSSSVYGNQKKVPFSESDSVDTPISPYAATKKACELFAYTYHHLYGFTSVGYRFFTVYGEHGRPDMAPYLFTERILKDVPIKKFGDGTTERDYTYVGDIVSGIILSMEKDFGYEIFNLGNHQSVSLNNLISVIEFITGKKAVIEQHPIQPGDVERTFADTRKAIKMIGYSPSTTIEKGMDRFITWYKQSRL